MPIGPFPPPNKRRRPPSPVVRPSSVERAKWSGQLPDKTIAVLVELISQSNLQASVGKLSGFHSRHSFSTKLGVVATWLEKQLQSSGYTTDRHKFTAKGHKLVNVVASKPGVASGGKTIIVGAHYDSIGTNSADPAAAAPGADDNATGVAVMLEVARLLRQVPLTHDIRFVAFSGEEQGLLGSSAYAQKMKSDAVKVHRYFNLDMVGYPDGARSIKIERDENNALAANDAASHAWCNTIAGLTASYTTLKPLLSGIYESDYMPFEALGYVVAGLYEAGKNSHYHKSTDTAEKVDMAYLAQVAKLVLAALLTESAPHRSEGAVDLYIRDSSQDTGVQPSKSPHWHSPDIWVRNRPPPADPSDPNDPNHGEDPDQGHEIPIVGVANYLYVQVHNRGAKAAGGGYRVRAYHCNPGTAMGWPDHFSLMGELAVPGSVAPGGERRIGPFPWTPKVKDHECLLAIVDGPKDHAVPSLFTGRINHSMLVRYDNNVGQRNVSPQLAVPGGKSKTSFDMHGSHRESTNRMELDAASLPDDTVIDVRILRRIADAAATLDGLAVIAESTLWTTMRMTSGKASIGAFPMRSRDRVRVDLTVDVSVHAVAGKTYPIVATQYQDDEVAGRVTVEVTAVKESEDYVYGNPRSLELHTVKCPFWPKISQANKLPFLNIEDGTARGYNGCRFCLPEQDTD